MIIKENFEAFTLNFVCKNYRSRCIHDAIKKPDKFMQKVCHNISDVFIADFLNSKSDFKKDEPCLIFNLTGYMERKTWDEAINEVKNNGGGGGGYLIISSNGNKFYAESERESSLDIYAGTNTSEY